MNSFSIGFFGNWGIGKTSLIKTLTNELNDLYNVVEINLWTISNIFSKNENNYNNKDNAFVREIVKDSITQLLNNNYDYVRKYLNAQKENYSDFNFSIKGEFLNSFLLMDRNAQETTKIIQTRTKFIDEFILNLQETIDAIFSISQKPVIFVFDDMDRINEDWKIIKILNSIMSFLNLKNCVFIFNIDKYKIMRVLDNEYKEDDIQTKYEDNIQNNMWNDNSVSKKYHSIKTNDYLNKYFNYEVTASFIPEIDLHPNLKKELSKISNLWPYFENNDKLLGNISKHLDLSYRSIVSFVNLLSFNLYSFNINVDNKFLNKFIINEKNHFKSKLNNDDELYIKIVILKSFIQIKCPTLFFEFTKNINELVRRIEDFKTNKNANESNEYLFALFSDFGVSNFNNSEIILFWICLTNTNIQSELFVESLEASLFIEQVNREISILEDNKQKEKFINFINKLPEFVSGRVMTNKNEEAIVLSILENTDLLQWLEKNKIIDEFKYWINNIIEYKVVNNKVSLLAKVIDYFFNVIDSNKEINVSLDDLCFLIDHIRSESIKWLANNLFKSVNVIIEENDKKIDSIKNKLPIGIFKIICDKFHTYRIKNTFTIRFDNIPIINNTNELLIILKFSDFIENTSFTNFIKENWEFIFTILLKENKTLNNLVWEILKLETRDKIKYNWNWCFNFLLKQLLNFDVWNKYQKILNLNDLKNTLITKLNDNQNNSTNNYSQGYIQIKMWTSIFIVINSIFYKSKKINYFLDELCNQNWFLNNHFIFVSVDNNKEVDLYYF